jgi:predicted nicotinamide N-methyase
MQTRLTLGDPREIEAASPPGMHEAIRIVPVGRHRVQLAVVDDLEAFVDREALLRAEDPDDPPYWAHLWTGAIELARYVEARRPCAGLRVLDLGCGLGLVGIVASLEGARVTFLDRDADALAFAARSAERNACRWVAFRQNDFTTDALGETFDLILGAEVLYDTATWAALSRFLAAHLGPGGVAILADAHRTQTAGFYEALATAHCSFRTERVAAREEGLPLAVDIVTVGTAGSGDTRALPATGERPGPRDASRFSPGEW